MNTPASEIRQDGDGRPGSATHRDRYRTALSIAIAVLSLAGSVIAWTATSANSAASDADAAGLAALDNIQRASIASAIITASDLEAFTSFSRDEILGRRLQTQLQNLVLSPEETAALRLQIREHNNVSAVLKTEFFPSEYRTGQTPGYDDQRQRGEEAARRTSLQDTRSLAHFREADETRNEAKGLLLCLVVLGGAVMCCTLAFEGRTVPRLAWSAAALVLSVAGLANAATLVLG